MLLPKPSARSRRHSRPWAHQQPTRTLRFETLESRQLLAAIPVTTLDAPSQALLGETVALSVGFSNSSLTDAGYGPYIDLLLPATGSDGAGAETDDGLTFATASYHGETVTSTVLTFDAAGNATHPIASNGAGNPLVVTGTPGDQLVVLQLPFGSYAPGQPTAVIDVTLQMSPLADANVPLNVESRGGFRFGNNPLNDPQSDPSVIEATWHNDSVEPVIYVLRKEFSGPEGETATGPNFERQYTVIADLADGLTITSFELTDTLPDNIQFLQVDATLANGGAVPATNISTPSTTLPGGILTRGFNSVTGTSSDRDVEMTFSFFVPHDDASGADVLDSTTGNDSPSRNDAAGSGNWTPLDPRDPPTPVNVDAPGFEYIHTNKSLAVQKSAAIASDLGAPGPSPGDTIEYTLEFQVSDYFSIGDLLITDILSDGQRFDTSFTPTFSVTDRSGLVADDFTTTGLTPDLIVDLSQIGNDLEPATDGSTRLEFNVSQALVNAGAADGIVQGGRTAIPDSIAAIGIVTFRTTIEDAFSDTYTPNTPNVASGDLLSNEVVISGTIRDNNDINTVLDSESDNSAESVNIVTGTLTKEIYAINGSTSIPTPVQIAPGDAITYRLLYQLPITDFDGLTLVDYLPLPVFDATQLTVFDATPNAAPPAEGTLQAGPSDTFHALTALLPALTTSASSNSFTVTYAAYDEPNNLPSTLDLLATFTVSDTPFADGLILTNQLVGDQTTTNEPDLVANINVPVTLTEPVLEIAKGVVATDNPAGAFAPATVGPVTFSSPGSANPRFSGSINSTNLTADPIDSDLYGIDAGDLVTFAMVVENTGSGLTGAFDVQIRDTLPTGFAIPASGLNLSVSDGSGGPLSYTDLGGGLFGGGIELNDNPSAGSLAPLDPTNGLNIAIITYDLLAESSVEAASVLENTATLFNYAGVEGGSDHTTTDLTDTAEVQITRPNMAKATPDNNAVIGQIVSYEVTLTIPEGVTPDVAVVDTLDAGLAFVGLTDVATSNPSDVSWSTIVSPSVANTGHTITFDLGAITNTNRNNSVAETITISYQVVVLNVQTNQQGTPLDNAAVMSWSGTSLPAVSADPIIVTEPSITTTKSAIVGGSGTTGDAGDAVQYSVILRNASGLDAFDATFADNLPNAAGTGTLIVSPTFNVVDSAGSVQPADFEMLGDNTSGWTLQTRPGVTFDMLANPGRTIAITISGTLAQAVQPDQTITNRAETRFTSIDAEPGTISTYNPDSTERTGENGVGGGLNNYATDGSAAIDIYDPTPVKSLVSSSEGSTNGNSMAIGEIVRFRLVSRMPESTAPNTELVDLLPAGLRLLDDGTTTVAFIANDGGISSSTLSGPGLVVSGNESTIATVTPTFPLPPTAIGGGPFVSGADPIFQLGTLTNTDRDSDIEYVIVEFNALVENVVGNQAGTTLNNAAQAHVDGAMVGVNSNVASLSVVEPSITDLLKTATPTTGDAGDTISYEVSFTNPASANVTSAFNLLLTDTLPAELALNLSSISVTTTGATGVIDESIGNTVEFVIGSLAPGGSIHVEYQAELLTTVMPEELVQNTANLTYTSLPDDGTMANSTGSNTPGPGGSDTGERDGSGGVNDYSVSDGATVTIVEPATTKVILSTNHSATTGTDVAVGEQVTYELTFSVVEGTTPGVTVTDPFPTGMALMSLDTITASPSVTTNVAGGFAGALSSSVVSTDGTSFTIDLGTLFNSDNDNGTTETISVSFTAVILNHVDVQDGVDLINSATVAYASGDVTATAPAVHVVEPVLTIAKTPSSSTGDAGGQSIMFTITVSHDTAVTTADAFGVLIEDTLPAGLDYVPGTLAHIAGIAPTTLVESNGTLTAVFDVLAMSDSSTLEFSAVINGTTVPGQTIDNVAAVTYTSLPGDLTGPQSIFNSVSTERTGDTNNPGSNLNDYQASNSATVTVNSNSLAGYVYVDINNDGTRDTGEAGLPGVDVTLTGTDNLGNAVATTLATAADGSYLFDSLRPGTYSITEIQPAAYLDGDEAVGSQNGTVADDRINMTLPTGSQTTGIDNNFGELPPASIVGSVYSDSNNDGQQQVGEAGIENTVLQLTGTDDRGTTVDLVANSNIAGAFLFGNLRPGTYTLTETQPVGWLDGIDALGTQGGTPGNDTITRITLDPGTTGVGNLFGELEPASLSGLAYEDTNNDGVADAAEQEIAGVTITLQGTDDLAQQSPAIPRQPRMVHLPSLTCDRGPINYEKPSRSRRSTLMAAIRQVHSVESSPMIE